MKVWVIYDWSGNAIEYYEDKDRAKGECNSWNEDWKRDERERGNPRPTDNYYVGSVNVEK